MGLLSCGKIRVMVIVTVYKQSEEHNMKRNCTLEEISDGKLYELEDLVEASCNGCKGKASCCHGMGNSIVLDPYDIYRITIGTKKTFEALLTQNLELNMVDGVILPNLKLSGETDACTFLQEDGKCSIHGIRPGICRIFPLGRYYENHDFKYILQIHECKNSSNTKTKVINWIDTPDADQNKKFLIKWHYFLGDVERIVKSTTKDQLIKQVVMYVLNQFYVKGYEADIDFYPQFEERMIKATEIIHKLQVAERKEE